MKNDTQFRNQKKLNTDSKFPMRNKIQATEEKLEALKHPDDEAQREPKAGGRIEHLKETLSGKLTELKTAVQTQVEELKENPKVKAAAEDVTTWVKAKAEQAQVLAPIVVARVKKAIKTKAPVRAVRTLKAKAKKVVAKKAGAKAKAAPVSAASAKSKKQAKAKPARLH